MDPILKHLGLGYVLFSWAWGYLLMKRFYTWGTFSTSMVARSSTQAYLLFATCLSISAISFGVFCYNYLSHVYGLGWPIKIVIGLIIMSQLMLAWINGGTGWRRVGHNIAAFGMGGLLLAFVVLSQFESSISQTARLDNAILASVMTYLGYRCIRSQQRKSGYFIVFQQAFILCFHLALLAITYL